MKRTQKFAELRKNLKQELRNPGEVELDKEIEVITSHKINKPVVVSVTCMGVSSFLAGYALGRTKRSK